MQIFCIRSNFYQIWNFIKLTEKLKSITIPKNHFFKGRKMNVEF